MFGDSRSEAQVDPVMFAAFMGSVAMLCMLALVAVEWPVLVWSLVHARPMLLDPTTAIGGAVDALFSHDPLGAHPHAWRHVQRLLPPPGAWVTLDGTLLVVGLVAALAAGVRFERWKGRSRFGLRSWDPRARLERRAWASPRDLLHLQRRQLPSVLDVGVLGFARALKNRVTRFLAGERREPAPAGGDNWLVGVKHGTELRSAPEQHALVVAPSGSGKTMRTVTNAVLDHGGAAVVISTKPDVLQATAERRMARGKIHVFAPTMGRDPRHPVVTRWTPLAECKEWDGALSMGRWLYDANPALGREQGGGAEFFNREATEVVLPPLLFAAALDGRSMASVYKWLSGGGVIALDEPAEILAEHGATAGLEQLRGIQHMPDRQRSYSLTSARQLVSAYQYLKVLVYDANEFDVEEFISSNDTLYLIAPESDGDLVAPIFGGLIGSILRACERRARTVADPRRLPLLKILADEAATLAPLRKLSTHLAVTRGIGVRWMVVYQSIAQLKHRYHQDADAILANTLLKQYLGPIHDKATRDELAALLGEEVVSEHTHNTDQFGRSAGRSRREARRAKAGAQDLATLPAGHAIVIHGNDLPVVVRVPYWWEWHGASDPVEALSFFLAEHVEVDDEHWWGERP